jgi:hypothetical protein
VERHHVFALTLACAVVSGIFSPYLQVVLYFAPVWLPSWLPPSPGVLFYLSSLIAATTVLLVSGVPAALVERLIPSLEGSLASLWIWFAGASILTLPALVRLVA